MQTTKPRPLTKFAGLSAVSLAVLFALNCTSVQGEEKYYQTTGAPTSPHPEEDNLKFLAPNNVPYFAIKVTVSLDGYYYFYAEGFGGYDPFMVLYHTAFKPFSALENALFADDDGYGFLSGPSYFEYFLYRGQTYIVVLTGYDNADYGNGYFQIDDFTGLGTISIEPYTPPALPALPAPIVPDVTAPSLQVTRKIVKNLKATIFGLASDNAGLARVEYRVGNGPVKIAAGLSNWTVRLKLKPGRSRIYITAVDKSNNASPALNVTVAGKE